MIGVKKVKRSRVAYLVCIQDVIDFLAHLLAFVMYYVAHHQRVDFLSNWLALQTSLLFLSR